MIHVEEQPDLASAVQRERQIKGWTRAKKLALASGNLRKLHELSQCRNRQTKQSEPPI